MSWIKLHSKSITQVVATILAALVPILQSGQKITASQWINVVIVGIGAVQVWVGTNTAHPVARYTKAILSGLMAVAVLLTSQISNGISRPELIQIAVAFLSAAGVLTIPNGLALLPALSAPVPQPLPKPVPVVATRVASGARVAPAQPKVAIAQPVLKVAAKPQPALKVEQFPDGNLNVGS